MSETAPVVDYFNLAMSFAWRPENDGQGPHNDRDDTGGETSWGVIFRTYSAWETAHGRTADPAVFLTLPKETFLPLYRANFWNACCCGSLDLIGIPMFDIGMMSGTGNAARFLQMTLGVTVDEQIGPKTIAAFKAADPLDLNERLLTERDDFYRSLPNAAIFDGGWERRASDCHDVTKSLIQRVQAGTPISVLSTADLLRTAGLANVT